MVNRPFSLLFEDVCEYIRVPVRAQGLSFLRDSLSEDGMMRFLCGFGKVAAAAVVVVY